MADWRARRSAFQALSRVPLLNGTSLKAVGCRFYASYARTMKLVTLVGVSGARLTLPRRIKEVGKMAW